MSALRDQDDSNIWLHNPNPVAENNKVKVGYCGTSRSERTDRYKLADLT